MRPSSTAGASVSEDLAWLIEALWPDDETRVARGGEAEGAFETYVVIPSARSARFLVPGASRDAGVASLRTFNGLRSPRVRMLRTGLASALGFGADRVMFRDRVLVGRRDEPSALHLQLKDIFGTGDICLAVGIPPRGPNRKPVLQVFTTGGRVLGFAKIGWNEVTAERVRREAAALRLVEAADAQLLRAPRLLHEGPWRTGHISVTAPLPLDVRRIGRTAPSPEVSREVAVLGRRRPGVLEESDFSSDLRARVARVVPEGERTSACLALIDAVERDPASAAVPLGACHGDWVPWNLASNRHLYAFDWEHWRDEAPVGMDLLHFNFQVAFVSRKRRLWDALTDALERSRPRVEAYGLRTPALAAVARLYLVEITLRAQEAINSGSPVNPRFDAAIDDALTQAAGERL